MSLALATQAIRRLLTTGDSLLGLHAQRISQLQRSSQPQHWRLQAAASGGGTTGSGAGRRQRREKVTFWVPNQGLLPFVHVTQRTLDDILKTLGAVGFEVASGACSRELEYLPEGGTVRVVLVSELCEVRPCTALPAVALPACLSPQGLGRAT